MLKVIKTDSEHEGVVTQLISALNVPTFRDACAILFTNGDVFTLSEELGQMGIVTLQGEQALPGTVELINSRAQLDLMKAAQSFVPDFLMKILGPIISADIALISEEVGDERRSILTAKVVEQSRQMGWAALKPYMTALGGVVKPFGELLVAGLYKFYFEKYRSQSQIVPNIVEVANLARKLDMLFPFLTLAICPECANYELLFSKSIGINIQCTRCRTRWSVLTVSEFNPSFAALKRANRDLPIFISAYLKSKCLFPAKVMPNVEFDTGDGKVEIDVWIQESATGIECKTYTRNYPVTGSTLNSEAGKISKQITNYLSCGINRMFVVTNFSEADAGKLEAAIKTRAGAPVNNIVEFRVLGSDLAKFGAFLDGESAKLNAAIDDRIGGEMINKAASQQTEAPLADNTVQVSCAEAEEP